MHHLIYATKSVSHGDHGSHLWACDARTTSVWNPVNCLCFWCTESESESESAGSTSTLCVSVMENDNMLLASPGQEKHKKQMALSHARTYLISGWMDAWRTSLASTCSGCPPLLPTQHSLAGMPKCSLLPLMFPSPKWSRTGVSHLSCTCQLLPIPLQQGNGFSVWKGSMQRIYSIMYYMSIFTVRSKKKGSYQLSQYFLYIFPLQ